MWEDFFEAQDTEPSNESSLIVEAASLAVIEVAFLSLLLTKGLTFID